MIIPPYQAMSDYNKDLLALHPDEEAMDTIGLDKNGIIIDETVLRYSF